MRRLVILALALTAFAVVAGAASCSIGPYYGGTEADRSASAATNNKWCQVFGVAEDLGDKPTSTRRFDLRALCDPARSIFVTQHMTALSAWRTYDYKECHGAQGCITVTRAPRYQWGAYLHAFFRLNNPDRNWRRGFDEADWCEIYNNSNRQSILHCRFSWGQAPYSAGPSQAGRRVAGTVQFAGKTARLPVACAGLSPRSWERLLPGSRCAIRVQQMVEKKWGAAGVDALKRLFPMLYPYRR
jgi:hypothetical protein